jgi:hypothetical protein
MFFNKNNEEGEYNFETQDEFDLAIRDAARETLEIVGGYDPDDDEVYAFDLEMIVNDATLAFADGNSYRDQAGYTWQVEYDYR